MKRLIFVFVLIGIVVTGYCQQNKNEVRWRDLQGMTFTAGTNFSISGSYPSWTFTPSLTPTFTTVNTGQGANELYDMDQNVQTTDSPTFAGITVSGTAGTASLTVNGSHTVTGYLNPQGPFYADSSLYFGCDYSNTWMRFFYQQVGIPRSRWVIENMADYYIQAKNGLSQVLAIQRDTSLTESGVNHLNVVKQVYLGKDTTGIGSTANIGTTLYYNGHFYGLIAGTPPVWKQLDN